MYNIPPCCCTHGVDFSIPCPQCEAVSLYKKDYDSTTNDNILTAQDLIDQALYYINEAYSLLNTIKEIK